MTISYAASLSILVFVLLFPGRRCRAVSVEERLDQINRHAGKQRTETLEKEARKEGEARLVCSDGERPCCGTH